MKIPLSQRLGVTTGPRAFPVGALEVLDKLDFRKAGRFLHRQR
jgi:hypothetical protein